MALVLVAAALVAAAAPARAGSWPGRPGRIVYTHDPPGADSVNQLWTMEPDGSDARPLVGSGPDFRPAVSPDGNWVAFDSIRTGDPEVWVAAMDGSELRRLTNSPGVDLFPEWSPDGTEIAFTSERGGGGDIWVMAADGSRPRQITTTGNNCCAVWSSRDVIAFQSQRTGVLELFTMRPDGSDVTPLTSAPGRLKLLGDWSPDGAWLAFSGDLLADNLDVYVINADGTGLTRLTTSVGADWMPAWSPDGTTIAFASDRHGGGVEDLYLMTASGADQRRLGTGSGRNQDPVWQPRLDPLVRLAGPDRIETAIAVSASAFPAAGTAQTVVLARSDVAADVLAGTPLAVARDGPILLTGRDNLDPRTRAEVQRVASPGATVHVLGGTVALSDQVVSDLESAGFTVVRHAGPDRFATATRVADAVGPAPANVVLADGSGDAFAEALVGGVLAGVTGGVVLLTDGPSLSGATAAWLDAQPSVPRIAVGAAAAAAEPAAAPVVGADQYETAVRVAELTAFRNSADIGLASGETFPDGLTGGARMARLGAPLLLTPSATLAPVVRAFLTNRAAQVSGGFVFGGAVAVAAGVQLAAERAMTGITSG